MESMESVESIESVDFKRFARLSAVNGSLVAAALGMYVVFLNTVFPLLDLSLLLGLETGIVFSLQSLLGMPVIQQGRILLYTLPSGSPLSIELISECAGVVEMLIFVIMLAVFRGAGRQAKIKGILIFLPVIFAVNILRLAMLYPLAAIGGIESMIGMHYLTWRYGQLAVLLLLFGLWYLAFASRGLKLLLKKG
jgi:exosortase/archaeosortase family protein